MPPLAVCQGVYRLAVPARFARWIPDTPDAVDDCIESGANGGGTPGGGPPTTRAGRCRGLCRYRDLLDLKVHVRIPTLKNSAQLSVERPYSRLSQQMRPFFRPLHLLLLAES